MVFSQLDILKLLEIAQSTLIADTEYRIMVSLAYKSIFYCIMHSFVSIISVLETKLFLSIFLFHFLGHREISPTTSKLEWINFVHLHFCCIYIHMYSIMVSKAISQLGDLETVECFQQRYMGSLDIKDSLFSAI